MVLAAYALFWWFCWFLSGLFSYQKAKNPLRRRKWVCFWILMAPMYFHAFEYALLLNACSNAPVYLPEKKVAKPDILIVDSLYKNSGKYSADFDFEYIISAPTGFIKKPIDLSLGVKQFAGWGVYKHIDNIPHSKRDGILVEGERRNEVFRNARYGQFYKSRKTWNLIYSHRFIYDFFEQKKIAAYTYVHQNIKSESVRGYLTLFRLPECSYNHGKYKRRDLGSAFLLENTFIKENK